MNYKLSKLSDCGGDTSQRWYVYYFFRDPEDEKWIRFTKWLSSRLITRSQRYEAAREIRRSIDMKLRQGWNPFVNQNRGLTTIEKSVEYFLASKGKYIRYRTLISYRSHLKLFREWLLRKKHEQMAVESFNYYMADDFMEYVSSSEKLCNRTWNNYLQTLRCFFNFLTEKEYILVNPFVRIHELPTEQTSPVAFTREELDLVSIRLPEYSHDLYVIALLIFNCFLRPQEIVRLQVHMLKNLGKSLIIAGKVSKNKKNQPVVIPMQLQSEIKKMNLNFPGDYYVFGLHLKRAKKQIAPTRIAEQWRSFANLYGIEKNIYALKHTGNGMALEAGANARDLQLQNRHSSLEETQKYLERFSRLPSDKFISSLPSL